MKSKRPVHIKQKSKINRERAVKKMSLDPYIIKRPITAVPEGKSKPPPKRGVSSNLKYTMRDKATLNARE